MSVGYHNAQKLLHWAMAALLISMLLAGLAMVQSLATWQPILLSVHKSFGLLALLLVVIRLVLRWRLGVPALPSSVPTWQQHVARLSHYALYALMLLIPVVGVLMQHAAGRPIEFFGLFTIPSFISMDLAVYGLLRNLHEGLAFALIVVMFVHISAALQHKFVKQDGVFEQIAPSSHAKISKP